jgi:hypothetical protein
MDLASLSSPSFIVGLIGGILLGWASLWCFLNPTVGRAVVRIFAVLALGTGVWFLAVAVVDMLHGEVNNYALPGMVANSTTVWGWGAGCLVAGITALVLSFLGRRNSALPRG